MNIVPPSSSGIGNVNVNKKHGSSDRRPEGTPSAKVQRLDGFVRKTTKSEKEVLDEQIARFVYATNSSFRLVEHEQFIK